MTGLLAVGAVGVLPSYAQDSKTYPPIIQKLAERFNLNQDEVAEVFEEQRAEHHAKMLANFEDKLSEKVESGDITEEQKQAILDKYQEMRAKMDELVQADLDKEEAHEQIRAYHEELRAWAQKQGIDLPLFGFWRGFKMGQHFRKLTN